MELKLYVAEVKSLSDSEEKGKIQIKVIPEMNNIIDDNLLPWAFPFFGNSNSSKESMNLNRPEVSDLIWVLIDKEFQVFYYLNNFNIEGFFDFSKIDLSGISDIASSDYSYDTLDFTLYKNGNIDFQDRTSGIHGILHNTGSYFLFDSEGNIVSKSVKGIKLYNSSANIEIKDNGDVEVGKGNKLLKITDTGVELGDSTSNTTLKATGASLWQPNGLPNCLFTGAPHGGAGLGITGLKGG